MPVPGWFQATDYFYNKLEQMQGSNSSYTAQNLLDAFNANGYTLAGITPQQINAGAEQLFRHFNEWGNAENVSPNNYFDVDYYIQQKIAQCKATGQTPPDGFAEWTPESLWAALQNNGIESYWDHYIMWGTKEGINPSAQFNTNEYLALKTAQLNSVPLADRQPLPDGSQGTWTPALVAEAFKLADLNAVEHYMLYNASEKIGYVPAPENPVVSKDLTTADDVIGDDGLPTTFVGDVSANPIDSTLNSGDQITGTMRGDTLQATLADDFDGFTGKGFMKGVETVNVINGTADGAAVTWNADGTEGVTNYDVNGYVSLENLTQTGITINYSNINNRGQGKALIDFNNTSASNDTLNINLGENVGGLNFQTSGIETITVTSDEGGYMNTYADGMQNLVLKGDAVFNIRTMTLSTRSLDMSQATADGNFVCLSRSEGVNQILGGSGNDSVSVRNLAPTAVIDGGAGEDSVKLRSTVGAYQLDMKNVETLNIAMASNLDIERQSDANPGDRLILDGSHTTGLKTFGIAGGNGYQFLPDDAEPGTAPTPLTAGPRTIFLTKYGMDQANVKVTGENYVDLNIDTIKNITLNVGNGSADVKTGSSRSIDSITGTVNLLDAKAVTINTTDNNAVADDLTPFDANLNAANATNLTLGTSQGAAIDINGGDLSDVAQITASGYSDVTIDATTLLANDAKAVTVNASSLLGADFTASFTGNTTQGGAKLTYTGTSTGENNITVDGTYNKVAVTGGLLADTLTINANVATAENKMVVTGDLGGGGDKVIINGDATYVDLSGLKGDYNITMPVGGNVELTKAGAVANITVGDSGGTINIKGVGGTTANVTCGKGADIIQVVAPTQVPTQVESVRDRYLSTSVDEFKVGTDKVSMGTSTNYAITSEKVAKAGEWVQRAGYDIDLSTVHGILQDFDGDSNHYAGISFEMNGSDVKNVAIIDGSASGTGASVIVLVGVDGDNITSAGQLFAS